MSQRIGGYFICVVLDKKLFDTKPSGGAFGTGLEFSFKPTKSSKEKQEIHFSEVCYKEVVDGELLCGFLTYDHKESFILEAIKNLKESSKGKFVKAIKFLRVEETKF
jgi:hypothetical protein